MISARDKLFGDLIKKAATFEMPALSLAYLMGLSFDQALAGFVGALAPALPALVDYVQARREVKRRNALTYMIGLSNEGQ